MGPIAIAATAILLVGSQHQEQWVVKGLIPAVPEYSDDLERLAPPSPLGDFDHDGRTDFAISGDSTPSPFTESPAWDQLYLYGGLLDHHAWKTATVRTEQFMQYLRIRLPLRTPTGWAILLDSGIRQSIELYDMQTRQLLGKVQLPPSPGFGMPPALGYEWVFPAGDVNQDGWDDAFWITHTNYWTYAGLIDGASLSVTWQHVEAWLNVGTATPSMGEPAALPDLDGDGVSDFMFVQAIIAGTGYGHVAVALSGRTGTAIWRKEGPGNMVFGNTWGRDLNDDGVSEVVFGLDNDSAMAVDGKTGQMIWYLDMDWLDPYVTSSYSYRHFYGSIISRSVLNGKDEVAMILRYHSPLLTKWAVAHLDGETGAIRAVASLPSDALPFGSERFDPDIYFPLGDVDRDGTMEFAAAYRSWQSAPPWYAGPTESYVIVGQRTLFLPDQAQIGDRIRADISIPSASSMDCLLLLSTNFLPDGGWTLEGVATNMDSSDPVFQAALGQPELRTRLSRRGTGFLEFVLPRQPALIGKRVHVRALIRDRASGEVWTVSSPASVLVVP